MYEYEIKFTHTAYESVYVVHVYFPNHASVYVFCAVSVPSSVYVVCIWFPFLQLRTHPFLYQIMCFCL